MITIVKTALYRLSTFLLVIFSITQVLHADNNTSGSSTLPSATSKKVPITEPRPHNLTEPGKPLTLKKPGTKTGAKSVEKKPDPVKNQPATTTRKNTETGNAAGKNDKAATKKQAEAKKAGPTKNENKVKQPATKTQAGQWWKQDAIDSNKSRPANTKPAHTTKEKKTGSTVKSAETKPDKKKAVSSKNIKKSANKEKIKPASKSKPVNTAGTPAKKSGKKKISPVKTAKPARSSQVRRTANRNGNARKSRRHRHQAQKRAQRRARLKQRRKNRRLTRRSRKRVRRKRRVRRYWSHRHCHGHRHRHGLGRRAKFHRHKHCHRHGHYVYKRRKHGRRYSPVHYRIIHDGNHRYHRVYRNRKPAQVKKNKETARVTCRKRLNRKIATLKLKSCK